MDTPPPPMPSASVTPQKNVPLVSAVATVVEDPDQDIWIAERPVALSPAQLLKINDDKQKGARQGGLDGYLGDMTALGAVKSTSVALDLTLATQAAGQVRLVADHHGRRQGPALPRLRPDLRPDRGRTLPGVLRVRKGVCRRGGRAGRERPLDPEGSEDLRRPLTCRPGHRADTLGRWRDHRCSSSPAGRPPSSPSPPHTTSAA
jgi:hypothetical protein